MSITVGQPVPYANVYRMGDGGPQAVSTEELLSGKKSVLIAVPGAFTPTCSQAHLPGYVVKSDELLARGVDQIVRNQRDLS